MDGIEEAERKKHLEFSRWAFSTHRSPCRGQRTVGWEQRAGERPEDSVLLNTKTGNQAMNLGMSTASEKSTGTNSRGSGREANLLSPGSLWRHWFELLLSRTMKK